MYEAEQRIKAKVYAVTALHRSEMKEADIIDYFPVPKYADPIVLEGPECSLPCLIPVICEYEQLFHNILG